MQFYIHHNMINTNLNQSSLLRILLMSASALYLLLHIPWDVPSFYMTSEIRLYDRGFTVLPSFLLQKCHPVFVYISLFIESFLSETSVGWTKPIPKLKTGFKKHIVQCTKKNWRWIYIDWEVLHKLCAIVCEVFKLYYTLL